MSLCLVLTSDCASLRVCVSTLFGTRLEPSLGEPMINEIAKLHKETGK